MKCIRCILVCDNDIGKTYFLISLTTNIFPGDYIPSVFDLYSLNIMIKDQEYNLLFELIARAANYKKKQTLSLYAFHLFHHNLLKMLRKYIIQKSKTIALNHLIY